jgi:conjugative transfer region lipoprotein (TIGR03751 family)
VLGGCATSKEKLLTHGDSTMMDIWQQEAGDGGAAGRNAGGQLLDARQSLRRPLTDADRPHLPSRCATRAPRATRSIASSSACPIPTW